MSYSPKTWQDGDVIRAEDLNNIEQGIASAGSGGSGGASILILNATNLFQDFNLDKTYTEIKTAYDNGTLVFLKYNYSSCYYLAPLVALYHSSGNYRLAFSRPKFYSVSPQNSSYVNTFAPSLMIFSASATSSYPKFMENVRTYYSYITDETDKY